LVQLSWAGGLIADISLSFIILGWEGGRGRDDIDGAQVPKKPPMKINTAIDTSNNWWMFFLYCSDQIDN
jgi:hypothetical protein